MKKSLSRVEIGSIYYVDLGVEIDHCIGKKRPCVVVDQDRLTVTVIPISNNDNNTHYHSSEIPVPKGIGNLKKNSKLKMGQIRTVDRSKIISSMIGRLPEDYLVKIQHSIEKRILHRLENAKHKFAKQSGTQAKILN
jgi:mRNA-degrading endonuclease toxin of MazEF toxin-antitoxin module